MVLRRDVAQHQFVAAQLVGNLSEPLLGRGERACVYEDNPLVLRSLYAQRKSQLLAVLVSAVLGNKGGVEMTVACPHTLQNVVRLVCRCLVDNDDLVGFVLLFQQ